MSVKWKTVASASAVESISNGTSDLSIRMKNRSTALTPRATNVSTGMIIYFNIYVSTRVTILLRPPSIQHTQLPLQNLLLMMTVPRQRLSALPHLRRAAPAEQSAHRARLNRLRPPHQSIRHVLLLHERRAEMLLLLFHAPTPFLRSPLYHLPITTPVPRAS